MLRPKLRGFGHARRLKLSMGHRGAAEAFAGTTC
jgi:hypothetical protein